MSDNACQVFGINKKLFSRVCPGSHKANAEGFARMYISGLHRLIGEQDAIIRVNSQKVEMLKEQLRMKDEMIALLRERSAPKPSAPPAYEMNSREGKTA